MVVSFLCLSQGASGSECHLLWWETLSDDIKMLIRIYKEHKKSNIKMQYRSKRDEINAAQNHKSWDLVHSLKINNSSYLF